MINALGRWLAWLDPNRGSRGHDMRLIVAYVILTCGPVAGLLIAR